MRRQVCSSLLLAVAVLSGCSQPPPEVIGDISLEMNPSGLAPLAGLLSFVTDQPVRVSLTIGTGDSNVTVTPKDEFNTEHELMVLGLRAGRRNTVQINLANQNGDTAQPPVLTIDAPPLPDDFPPINVTFSRPALMEPGYTLMPIAVPGDDGQDRGYVAAVDAQGEVVWWIAREYGDQVRMQNGNFLGVLGPGRQMIGEFDMFGNVVRRWYAARVMSNIPANGIPVAIDTMHHDAIELPSGNILAISSERRHFEDYPSSATDPDAPRGPRTIIGDHLVEFQKDGTIVREWHLLDLIDPYRLGYASLSTGYFSQQYAEVLDEPAPDFTHGNGIHYLADEDALILSIRKANALVKINLGENRLEWILGDPAGWREPWSDLVLEPVGPIQWFSGQHAPEVTPMGTILIYDNGAYGNAFPPNPRRPPEQDYSRGVEYAVDEENMTVRQVWSYGDLETNRFWGAFLGDIDWQEQTGNILITNGAQIIDNDGNFVRELADGRSTVLVTEVTHTDPPEKVWEVSVADPVNSYVLYRAERIPSLYP